MNWLKEGDHNTLFFHIVASCCRNTNYILSFVDVEGNEVALDHVKDHMVSHFMKLFKESGIRIPKLNGVQFRRIFTNSTVWLECPFEEEVRRVV